MTSRIVSGSASEDLGDFVRDAQERIDAGEALRVTAGDVIASFEGDAARTVLALLAGKQANASTPTASLTTGQVADLLGVSRPTVVALVDSGELPATRVGTHRRVRAHDALAYRERRSTVRRQSLDELTRLSEDAGLYDA